MAIQLRQLCLVAERLEPVVETLCDVFGLERCYVDPGVGVFGLENTLMPVGRNFLEVVAPVQPDTAAGRYLERRGGDGGYMVITQADSPETQSQVRRNALEAGVRIAHETERGAWRLCQLHPRDMVAAFLEIESDAHNDFTGHWHPVGGTGWEDKVRQDVTLDWRGVALQGPDPEALAALWARVLGLPVETADGAPRVSLENAYLRFVEARDGRGPGLAEIDLAVVDGATVKARAAARGLPVTGECVDVAGVRWNLGEAG